MLRKNPEIKETTIAGIYHVSGLLLEESANFDETRILVVVGGGGGAVENVCGRHLKYGYNVCKIS